MSATNAFRVRLIPQLKGEFYKLERLVDTLGGRQWNAFPDTFGSIGQAEDFAREYVAFEKRQVVTVKEFIV